MKHQYFSKNTTSAVKGVAIILMLFYHLFSCSEELVEKYQVDTRPFTSDQLLTFSSLSNICVAIFVFLTAYGITISISGSTKSVGQSAVRRFWKLERGFWVIYALSIATCFLRSDHLDVYLSRGTLEALRNIFLDGCGLASLFGSPTYNETWWYMTTAILLIFLIPVLAVAYEKYTVCVFVIISMLPYFEVPYNQITMWLFSAVLGIWAAKSRLFSWLYENSRGGKRKVLLLAATVLFLFGCVCLYRFGSGYFYWLYGIMSLLLTVEIYILVDIIRLPLPVLRFLGKHSMNMFLIHTLIFKYYFTDLIYKPKHWLLILLLLLGCSLAVSVVIELGKNTVRKIFAAKKAALPADRSSRRDV